MLTFWAISCGVGSPVPAESAAVSRRLGISPSPSTLMFQYGFPFLASFVEREISTVLPRSSNPLVMPKNSYSRSSAALGKSVPTSAPSGDTPDSFQTGQLPVVESFTIVTVMTADCPAVSNFR